MKPEEAAARIRARSAELGLSVSDAQVDGLLRYGRWLVDEALPAGALGPREAPRVLDRHVLDSLAFTVAWETPPRDIVDVGSGAGLPGVPLAVIWPESRVVLLDRSGRRARLARRALRVLDLPNGEVKQDDVDAIDRSWPAAVMRGVFAPEAAVVTLDRLLDPDGRACVGVGAGVETPPAPPGRSVRVLENHSMVLARTVRLLIMAPL